MIKGFFKLLLFELTIIAIPFAIFAITCFGDMAVYNFLKEFPKEQLELINKFADVISPVMFIAAPAVPCGFYFKSKKRRKEIVRLSEENNTFVTARLDRKRRLRHDSPKRSWDYECIYEYTVNGKTKEHHICLTGLPPDELRLYPKSENRNKFFSERGSDRMEWYSVQLIGLTTIVLWIWIGLTCETIESLI